MLRPVARQRVVFLKEQLQPHSNLLTLAEAKRWLSLEPDDDADDHLLENDLIPMAIGMLQEEFELNLDLTEVTIEYLTPDRLPDFDFPRRYQPDLDAAEDIEISYLDCSDNPEDPSWTVLDAIDVDGNPVWELVPNDSEPFIRYLGDRCNSLCLATVGCDATKTRHRIKYQSGGSCPLTYKQKLWMKFVLGTIYRNRESMSEFNLRDTSMYQRLSAGLRNMEYPR